MLAKDGVSILRGQPMAASIVEGEASSQRKEANSESQSLRLAEAFGTFVSGDVADFHLFAHHALA
jgi:hypothetical protein